MARRHRTFIALDLGKNIRDRLVSLQESFSRVVQDVKWVEPENLHLTLLFIGEVDERDMLAVCRGANQCCQSIPRFRMDIETVGCFGNPRRPRTIWVGVGEGASEVTALHGVLEEKMLELGCYRREERAFTPHITLGRVKQTDESSELATLLAKKADWQAGAVDVAEVLVMSSELMPQGPIYTVLSRARLGSA